MRLQSFKAFALILFSIFALTFKSVAQQDVEALFKANPQDATKLIGAYLNPLMKGIGTGLNSGWYHTAKSKGTFKFEVRISAAGALVPTSDQSYDVNKLGLTNIRPVNSSVSIGPTAFGEDKLGAEVEVHSNNISLTKFRLPQGLGFNIVPTPQIQLTFGLPKNIDVMARYVPSIKINDEGKVGMFGLGAKVELLPLLMSNTAEKVAPFDVSFGFGYSHVNFDLALDVNNGKYKDQKIESKFSGFNMDATISKKLAVFTPFASLGYQTSTSKLNALGTYEFDNGIAKPVYTNPISINDDNFNGMRATVGFQLKLAFFKLYSSYTAFKYNTVNAGISFGVGQ